MQVYAYTSASVVGVLILSTLVLVQCASYAIWSHQAAAVLRYYSRSLPVRAADASHAVHYFVTDRQVDVQKQEPATALRHIWHIRGEPLPCLLLLIAAASRTHAARPPS